MGLDMYAYITNRQFPTPTPDDIPQDALRIHYWRKHPNLHGWMEGLYRSKGGRGTFNCTPLVLDADDLSKLEHAVRSNDLPLTGGFFFGQSMGDETDDDLEFIENARKALKMGLTVLYNSWW